MTAGFSIALPGTEPGYVDPKSAKPDPALVRECMAENRDRLMGIARAATIALGMIDPDISLTDREQERQAS